MIKIAICDDNEKELNQAISACHDYIKIDPSIDVEINIYLNSKDLLTNVQSNNLYDIYLLDIYMPEISGLELASIIKEQKKKAEIIFLTSSMSHAIDAFTLNATHYIVKPYTKENFGMGLKKAMDNIKDEIQSQIVLKTKNGTERIEFRDIYYSETEGHIQQVYTTHNKVLAVRMSSIDLYNSLSKDKRFRLVDVIEKVK